MSKTYAFWSALIPKGVGAMIVGLGVMLLALPSGARANPSNPCLDPAYGLHSGDITLAMYSGTQAAVQTAINAGKTDRGDKVGCPGYPSGTTAAYTWSTPNPTPVTFAMVSSIWNANHKNQLANFTTNCVPIGRDSGAAILGGYYARLSSSSAANLADLEKIANASVDAQYAAALAPSPGITPAGFGSYAYEKVPTGSTCNTAISGAVTSLCNAFVGLCPVYTAGAYSGRTMAVGDQVPASGMYDGGMAYDHGYIGALMTEAAIQASTPALKTKYQTSLSAAASWSANEPAVRNHNYTAKNVWVLSLLYAYNPTVSGLKTVIDDRMNRTLLPGILVDLNSDGKVDGMANQPFSGLADVAQREGRMWDGHNALPYYGAKTAWAVTDAYVAYRDNGNTTEKNLTRPYAIKMLNNIAWEVNNKGVPSNGRQLMAFALLNGLWKICNAETLTSRTDAATCTNMKNAVWALWNSGQFNSFGNQNTWVAGMYLLYLSNTPYVALKNR